MVIALLGQAVDTLAPSGVMSPAGWGPIGLLASALVADKSLYYFKRNKVSNGESVLVIEVGKIGSMLNKSLDRLATIERKTDDLHDWHKPDSDGEQTWKNKHMLKVLEDVTKALNTINNTLVQLAPLLSSLGKRLD